MEADTVLDKLKAHLTLEQNFAHRVFLDSVKRLSESEADELLGLIYASYLIRGKLLENIVMYCVEKDIDLPCFGDLIDMA
jgi:hypothetical protein